MTSARHRAVFLDRDGVINRSVGRGGVASPPQSLGEFDFLPGVREAVNQLRDAGFKLVVVTNQPDIARGAQDVTIVNEMNEVVRSELGVDAIFVCPHGDDDECECRKPKPGMLLKAMVQYDLDVDRSFMVGDRWRDVAAGRAAGCRTIQVGSIDEGPLTVTPTMHCVDLADAARWILSLEDEGNGA